MLFAIGIVEELYYFNIIYLPMRYVLEVHFTYVCILREHCTKR